MNNYVEDLTTSTAEIFDVSSAEAYFNDQTQTFYIKKKRPGDEIQVKHLSSFAQKLFLDKGGSRSKEWTAMQASGPNGPAIRVYRGKEARELRAKFAERILPTRWHEKWKDMGDDYDNGLKDPEGPKHLGPKSRWIIQGFHDPDIAILNRAVPTPATTDVPLSLQMLSSLQAQAWVGDVKSAFTQGLRGLRKDRLFADPPPGGFPGEDDDLLIELLAEVYGLITGPPAWRQTLITTFRELGFKKHPLAPCVMLMYEDMGAGTEELSGLIVIETDDLLGGGVGDKFHKAVTELKKRFTFGKWIYLQEQSTEYGGRTLKQHADYSIEISMVRYLKERAREVRLEKGRCEDPEALANESEITAMRGLMGKLNWATREGMPQGCGGASLLSATLPTPRIKDIQEANASLRRLLQANASITIRPIPLRELRLIAFADSSLGNAGGGSSQNAHFGPRDALGHLERRDSRRFDPGLYPEAPAELNN